MSICGTAALSILALLSVMFLFTASAVFASPTPKDSEAVTKLLSDVKSEAVLLRSDAEEVKSFTRSTLSWQSHAEKIEQIKQHVNAAGELLGKLHDSKASASAWQGQAIDRITPILRELAASVTSTIDHLNKNQSRIHTPPYTDYVASTAELATDLSTLITDYVAYGKAKDKSEELEQKLEVPGT